MIETFVNCFIKNQYKERILFELKSNKDDKREKAFVKLLDYEGYFKKEVKKIYLSNLTDEEIIKIVKSRYINKDCYSLRYNKKLQLLEKAVIDTINSCILDILIVDEKNIIYIGEVGDHNEGGMASIKFIAYI